MLRLKYSSVLVQNYSSFCGNKYEWPYFFLRVKVLELFDIKFCSSKRWVIVNGYGHFFSGKEYFVEFDFLGKDSIRYHNFVQVEKRVFKNLQLFMENKKGGDDLFDRLNTSILNEYLSSLMPGLTAKVFRTYNASITLQDQLNKLTDPDDNIPSKVNYIH